MAPPRALAHYRLWLQTSSPGVLPLPEPPDGLWPLPDPPPHGLWPTLVPQQLERARPPSALLARIDCGTAADCVQFDPTAPPHGTERNSQR